MRIVSLLVTLAVAAAVSLSHQPQQVSYGKSLFLEIQQKMDAGLPIEDLKDVINNVRTRITDAAAADAAQDNQTQTVCESDKAYYRNEIAEAREAIEALKGSIIAGEARYDALTTSIGELEANIAAYTEQINGLMATIESGRRNRSLETARFVNTSSDNTAVIAAIEEIKGIESGSTLQELFPKVDDEHKESVKVHTDTTAEQGAHSEERKQAGIAADLAHGENVTTENSNTLHATNDRYGETDSRYHNIKDYKNETETLFVQLSQMATRMDDEESKAFVELTAKAATALSGADYETLDRLLNELLSELKSHTEQLIKEEKAAALFWAKKEAELTTMLRSAEASKAKDQADTRRKYTERKVVAKQIQDDRDSLESEITRRDDNKQSLATRTAECDLMHADYENRKDERDEELTTLDAIEKIVLEKIEAKVNSNTRLKEGTRTKADEKWYQPE